MFLGEAKGYVSYEYFLQGYLLALDTCTHQKISWEFNRFVNKSENGIDSSKTNWNYILDRKHTSKNDGERIEMLLDLLERFVMEKESGILT